MPAEYVNSTLEWVDQETGKVGRSTFRVRVGWNREAGYTQIATVDKNGDPGSGVFVDLDRRGINDLIRILRKARDQAFGRDE